MPGINKKPEGDKKSTLEPLESADQKEIGEVFPQGMLLKFCPNENSDMLLFLERTLA